MATITTVATDGDDHNRCERWFTVDLEQPRLRLLSNMMSNPSTSNSATSRRAMGWLSCRSLRAGLHRDHRQPEMSPIRILTTSSDAFFRHMLDSDRLSRSAFAASAFSSKQRLFC
jgi:hypothetical protein